MCQVHAPEYRPPAPPSIRTREQFDAHCRRLPGIPRWALRLSLAMDYAAAGVPHPDWLTAPTPTRAPGREETDRE